MKKRLELITLTSCVACESGKPSVINRHDTFGNHKAAWADQKDPKFLKQSNDIVMNSWWPLAPKTWTQFWTKRESSLLFEPHVNVVVSLEEKRIWEYIRQFRSSSILILYFALYMFTIFFWLSDIINHQIAADFQKNWSIMAYFKNFYGIFYPMPKY